MSIVVELYTQNVEYYDKSLLADIAQDVINSSGVVGATVQIIVSVAIVDESEIRKINKELRGRDEITDVISVGEYSDNKDISVVDNGQVFLGEVVLCYNYIEESARLNKVSVDQEFFTVYSHGILHLLGFKHGEEMFKLQDDISVKFCHNK